MSTSNFMIKFKRSDGLSMTSVYEEDGFDTIFGSIVGERKSVLDLITKRTVRMMNEEMDASYQKHGVDYLPTRWSTLNGDEDECKLFLYTFFQRMGRNPEDDEEFSGEYVGDISWWTIDLLVNGI